MAPPTALCWCTQCTFNSPNPHRDGAREHGESVQLTLVRAPVVPIVPSVGEPPNVREWHAVVPLGSVNLVRKAGVVELTLEQRELIICDGYFEILKGCSKVMVG
jgi:hypothetical protein